MAAFLIIVAAGVVGVCASLLVVAWDSRKKTDGASAGAPGLAPEDVRRLSAGIALFVQELRSASDAVIARLDERERQLSLLVERAQQAQRELSRLVQQVGPAIPPDGESGQENGGRNRLSDIESRYTEVFQLHDRGLSLNEIAQQLSMEKGQLQLIFNLRRKI